VSRPERRTIEILVHQDRAGRVGGRPDEDASSPLVVGRLLRMSPARRVKGDFAS
jgi:hypothetical protein